MEYQKWNASTIDRWCKEGWEWGRPIDHETFLRAKAGEWNVVLTPTKPVPHAWFGELKGARVLGLASGGGQQLPVFTALGAKCTLLDICPQQCESERMVAQREGYEIEVIEGDMTKPFPFADETFDIIFNPVSFCYVKELLPIYRECCRVLKPGGAFLSGQDSGLCYAFADETADLAYPLPFDPMTDPVHRELCERLDLGYQFSHTLEEQIGGQLQAGLCLTHIFEDTGGHPELDKFNVPTFIATRAIKTGGRNK